MSAPVPGSWDPDEWVEVPFREDTVRLRGVSFKQYQAGLNHAVRGGVTDASGFAGLMEDDYGADAEVVRGGR